MSTENEHFSEKSEIFPFDREHRRKIRFNIGKYEKHVTEGKKQYCAIELAKRRAAYIKYKSINELDKYLVEFELKFTANGGRVIWARDAQEAVNEVFKILKKSDARNIVKSKSMATEEIGLNEEMKKLYINSLETGIGDFAIQLNGEKPGHIINPLINKSKEDVAEIFHKKFDLPPNSSPETIVAFVRSYLREKFIKADAAVTGVNFIIADTGAVSITENEGNVLLCVSIPKIHIAISGIEKIIPTLEDLDLYWSLLSTYGSGQNLTVYNSIITGPRQEKETDGPEEMYVVLIDNGRTNVLEKEEQRKALSCIRCGACLDACPIYKNIGGHAYGTIYSGPIGAVITPYMKGMKEYNHLSFASSLCGKCSEICPVKIPLHELLSDNRSEAIEFGNIPVEWKTVIYGWKKFMLNRWMIDFIGSKAKNRLIGKIGKKYWGSRRELPEIKAKSFNKLWKEKYSNE